MFELLDTRQLAKQLVFIGNPPFGHAGEYAIRDWFRRDDHAYLLQNLAEAERLDLRTARGDDGELGADEEGVAGEQLLLFAEQHKHGR